MAKIQIKNRYTEKIILEGEAENLFVRSGFVRSEN